MDWSVRFCVFHAALFERAHEQRGQRQRVRGDDTGQSCLECYRVDPAGNNRIFDVIEKQTRDTAWEGNKKDTHKGGQSNGKRGGDSACEEGATMVSGRITHHRKRRVDGNILG